MNTQKGTLVMDRLLSGNRRKWLLFAFGAIFLAVEVPLFWLWVQELGGWSAANDRFIQAIVADPLYQVTLIDFTATAMLILAAMILDTLKHRYPVWLLGFAFLLMWISPTLAVLAYLLLRPVQQPA